MNQPTNNPPLNNQSNQSEDLKRSQNNESTSTIQRKKPNQTIASTKNKQSNFKPVKPSQKKTKTINQVNLWLRNMISFFLPSMYGILLFTYICLQFQGFFVGKYTSPHGLHMGWMLATWTKKRLSPPCRCMPTTRSAAWRMVLLELTGDLTEGVGFAGLLFLDGRLLKHGVIFTALRIIWPSNGRVNEPVL